MADRVGQQIGNYRLIRLLGRGGFAEVYLAEHVHLDVPAVVKVLHIQLTPDTLNNFHSEMRTLALLTHPHIMPILDYGVENNTPFLVMGYTPHGSLRQHYPKGTQVPLATVVSYARQVAGALQYAHDKKIIHRDVKPENMLLERSNEIQLSDFGIALDIQNSQSSTGPQMVAGTVAYMAPEQLQGKPRPASDQYSLGIVVYEWLSGDQPFHGSSVEIATQHIIVHPPALRQKVPAIPKDVEEVVMIALAKDPNQRFKSVQAFANALEQASNTAQGALYPPPYSNAWGAPPPIAQSTHVSPPVQPITRAGSPAFPQSGGTPQSAQYAPAEPYPETPAAQPIGGSPFQGYPTSPGYYPETPAVQPGAYPPSTPSQRSAPHSSSPGLSSLFKAAGGALDKVFSGTGKRRTKETQLSLFAITRATLESDDRALVGKIYMIEAGISGNRPESFRAEPFDISVSNPTAPLLFDMLVHASDTIELTTEWHKRLSYYPLNPEPQLVQFTFKVVIPGQCFLAIDFYHQQRWLRTVRLTFDAVEQPQRTAVSPKA